VLKIAVGAAWFGAVLGQGAVQSPAVVQSATRASAGVYAETQAARGKDIFGTICSSCHNIASQSGTTFAKRWNGVALSELYLVMSETMPKDDPGALTEKERADVIAYLLKINSLPAGTSELPTDPELLKKIVIDLVK
jgi:mono/diheme cytochrome c family protein